MTPKTCPVNQTITWLKEEIVSGRITDPRTKRISGEIEQMLGDIAWGRAGEKHLPAIKDKLEELHLYEEEPRTISTTIRDALETNLEVFESHVSTQNCVTGECVKLAPAPCQMACPAGIDIPSYVTLIGMGKDAEAIEIIRKDNPFPWVCGLVCTRPCEFMCVRARMDTPVSIKFLKAYAAERAMSTGRYTNPEKEPDRQEKICIIGAGPGGMSAAYYLALKGYQVMVMEALPVAGGMMMVGIPRYRLPREVIDREVEMIRSLGVKFRFNTRFGQDITFETLKKEGFSAFLIAVGAHQAYEMGIPGEKDYPGVFSAIDFLRRVALGDRQLPGKKVVVVGGGNVAIDAARTSVRLGAQEVSIAYRRTHSEMPADEEEVVQAEEEDVKMSFLTVPIGVVGENGRVTGLKCLRAKLVKKEGSDRMAPVPQEGSDFVIDADAVIVAIGQKVDQECVKSFHGVRWSRRNTIDVDGACMQTSMEGVFAVGDAVTGPATVVEAIGGGKKAAMAIHRHLNGVPQPKMPPIPVRRARMDFIETPASLKMHLKKPEMPLLNINRRRIMFQQVELGYSGETAKEEARRCLRCDVCFRCGKCVEVCRDKMGINALKLGYLDFDHPVETDFRDTAEKCITCGACAANCPNGAMQMREEGGARILSLCGTVLNRLKLEYCEVCGAALGPARYHDFIQKRLESLAKITDKRRICETCFRRQAAERQNEEKIR